MNDGVDGLTVLLHRWNDGDASAPACLIPLVYKDLRKLARLYLRRERPNHTLQPTALVNEACLRLLDQRTPGWQNRAEFFSSVGTILRRVLVDHARRRLADKRADGADALPLDSLPDRWLRPTPEVLALDDALQDLARLDPQKAQLVELRFFVGLSMDEIAEALGLSVRTVHREWTVARAWLQAYMTPRN